ncbi:MAG: hypothetical protein ACH0QD_01455 [Tepidibacillus sp.]
MLKFIWNKVFEETLPLLYHGNTYTITATPFGHHYRIDLLENNIIVATENTENDTFKLKVNPSYSIEQQILNWGDKILEKHLKECDKCKKQKIVLELSENEYKFKEFQDYYKLCLSCREEIYQQIADKNKSEEQKELDEYKKLLKKNPPIIVGNFETEQQAYYFLKEQPYETVTHLENNYCIVKSILKMKDNTYYPALSLVEVTDQGTYELIKSFFFAYNHEDPIPQEFVMEFLQKESSNIFPYYYKSIENMQSSYI